MKYVFWCVPVVALFFVFSVSVAGAAEEESIFSTFKLKLETKAHYRHSEPERIALDFPFPPPMLPIGETQGFEETVDAGSHFEFSMVGIIADWQPYDLLRLHTKVIGIDYYDRNPTSSGHEIDFDQGWIRYGNAYTARQMPEEPSYYAQFGKFEKMEKQLDRHLESYGVVSTAFNRFKDTGFEIGADPASWFYAKGSWTTGSPVYVRDPNALAGDSGIPQMLELNPDPAKKSGIVLLYDTETTELDLTEDPEFGGAVGTRYGDGEEIPFLNFMLFGYDRNLSRDRSLHGSVYGTDLDLLDGPQGLNVGLGADGDTKTEYGGNLWLYYQSLTFFAQIVQQDLAGLDRTGYEAEIAYGFDLPSVLTIGGSQVFSRISPAFRFSVLDSHFKGSDLFPAITSQSDWQKCDYGVRLDVYEGLRLTIEYADAHYNYKGDDRHENEFLTTLHFVYPLL